LPAQPHPLAPPTSSSSAAGRDGCRPLSTFTGSARRSRKAAACFQVPNNGLIRERGFRDAKESTLRFLARSACPLATTPQTRTWACSIGSTSNSKPLRRKSEMSFAQEEIAFIKSQRLARIATVDDDDQPDVVPVGFEFDGTYFNIGGLQPANTRRHHNVAAGNHKVALVIDDVESAERWSPRFLRIYGTAEVMSGEYPYLRITPTISWSSNLSGESVAANHGSIPIKRTVHR
jgi:pyridoxamine 5'-phosphate oxidase family protein